MHTPAPDTPGSRSDTRRPRSGAALIGLAAVCVAAPAWVVTGSPVVAAVSVASTLAAIAAASIMI